MRHGTGAKRKIDNIRGAVMIAYPMGLPPYDEVRQELEDNAEIPGMGGQFVLDPNEVSLWWAGKAHFNVVNLYPIVPVEMKRPKSLLNCKKRKVAVHQQGNLPSQKTNVKQ